MGKKRTTKLNKCCVCSKSYDEKNLDAHAHSYNHHKAIQKINGSKLVAHRCWACNVSVIGLEEYKEHIAKDEHKQNLFKLKGKRQIKVNLPVDYDTMLDAELKNLCNKERRQRCFVCRHSFLARELDIHKHSFVHHLEIENLKGSEQVHKCWACDLSVTGMPEYKKHIGTANHKTNMSILTKRRSDNDKSAVDYREEFDYELKALCDQRDLQKMKKKELQFLKWMNAKAEKQKGKQKAPQTKLIKNFQMKNMSQSFEVPAKVGEDFTSDKLPTQCKLFQSLEDQQKISTSKPEPTTLKRRQGSILGMDNLNCTLVKRPCPPLEISAHVSGELTYAPEQGQREISTRTIGKPLDYQDVDVCSEENVESHMERVVRQTCKSYLEKELFIKGRTKLDMKHKKQERSTEYVSSLSSHKSTGEPCSRDAFYTLRNSQEDQIYTKTQQEQCMSRKHIHGQEASVASPSSVSSLAEKIARFHSRTKATCNVNVCQTLDVGGNDSFRTDTDTYRKKKNGYNAETSEENGYNAETSQEDLDGVEIISCYRKEQDISNTTHQNPETTCRQSKVNKLMTLSSREEELTNSLSNVGDQLFQAYATLQTAYTEVQNLLTAKQQVTSEMSSLRAKRIQLLKDMIE
ncbi:uncharacterized protein znf106b [Triplophysa dalaica]|uniref:uncharacterized protein znf106b n=1 Tax=Triplophysa dalaica TaxID=1582913 RepID=UPI0024E02EE5|nr:uncharacterized protein znf106b [Triplophysa dalaica]XP_056620302.1 uncharacterized protein znf106b [Triplophysa dalaica]XP_056620303.1 uncharacterized protein znf106b [Triplophysa dalaica]XP_056620305.1 uncharacterized protein znf106b [Triplophysa dalaica]